jgi:hypothetical protein
LRTGRWTPNPSSIQSGGTAQDRTLWTKLNAIRDARGTLMPILSLLSDHLPGFETVRIVYGMLLCRIQLSWQLLSYEVSSRCVDASHPPSLHHILHAIYYTYI